MNHFTTRYAIAIHLIVMACILLMLILCIVYPFLPGEYDPLAVPISVMVQVFGIAGLPLALTGLLWLLFPKHQFVFAIIAVAIATIIMLFLALIAVLGIGKVIGFFILFIWIYIMFRLIPTLKNMKSTPGKNFRPAPLYLVALPLITFAGQLVLLEPVTRWSTRRAISNAQEFISEIEAFRTKTGHYPLSLHAQHKDYQTNVVGVEKYFYAPQDSSYNLSFEQPRFVIDRPGTREWVVYNPLDEHRFYSHTAWLLLPPGTASPAQGWYASEETGFLHWKYFLFD